MSMSPKQIAIVIKKMKKYWKQILDMSDHGKLIKSMIADGAITKEQAFMYYL